MLSQFLKKLTLFELLLAVLAMLQLIHFFVLYSKQNFPIPLLCGPIFWVMAAVIAKKSTSFITKGALIALIPFCFFTIWRLLVAEAEMWNYLRWYTPIMLSIQTVYPIMIMVNLKRKRIDGEAVELLKQLMVFSLGISFFVCILFLKNYAKIDFTMDINPIHTIALATVFSACVMLCYLNAIYKQSKNELLDDKNVHGSASLEMKPINSSLKELLQIMDEEKLYLDPKLTLDKVAARSKCSKTEISSFLSNHLGYSYYEWLASYRIKHAKNMLDEFGDEYKLEAVAHASGFQSKTTFNRYFKELVGVHPSSYRERMYKNQAVV